MQSITVRVVTRFRGNEGEVFYQK